MRDFFHLIFFLAGLYTPGCVLKFCVVDMFVSVALIFALAIHIAVFVFPFVIIGS